MPFIDSKITVPVSPEKRETIKSQLGGSISLLNKTENYLMVGFEDNYDLYLGGNHLEKGAYVTVRLFGSASSDACSKMTGAICDILKKELDIPGENVYVSYIGTKDWGWNGRNF
ncbi:MAG: phenylpyruvate tautomerase MIF-related protein [Roseburia sp.]|nr:phenylpyruvate tautomerase MIF-related protein [Roseburia sp.]